VNVALATAGAISNQSSTSGTQTSSLAHDGLSTTYSLTNDASPWWEITLSSPGYVAQVQLVVDSTGCNLDGAVITLSDSSNNRVATRTLGSSCRSGFIDEFFGPACTCE
jgi:hypothetical protein